MRLRFYFCTFVFVLVFAVGLPQVAFAHIVPYMAVITELHGEGENIKFTTKFNAATAIKGVDEGNQKEQLSRVKEYYSDYFAVLYGETPANAHQCVLDSVTKYSADKQKNSTLIEGIFACDMRIDDLEKVYIVTDAFSDAFVKYDHYISVFAAGRKKDSILNQWVLTNFPISEEVVQKIFPAPPPGTINLARFEQPKIGQPQPTFFYVLKRFLRMGVEHILGGFDHILFLLSTILVLRSVRKMLVLVTAFTVAHSITLILAGLGIITLPSFIVEPFIAATIVVTDLWNLYALRRQGQGGVESKMRERWIVAFCFGLVHGLGFAGALVDVDLPRQYFVPALVFFNIGVEVGQLLIVCTLVSLFVLLIKKFPAYRKIILYFIFVLILIVSVSWFISRVVGALA